MCGMETVVRAPEILLSYEGNEGISGYFGLKYGKNERHFDRGK